jgi:hypothetical protein
MAAVVACVCVCVGVVNDRVKTCGVPCLPAARAILVTENFD